MNVLEMTSFDFLEQLIFRFCSERIVPLKHHVKEDTERPHISIDRAMIYLRYYLRSHIGWSTTESIDSLLFSTFQTETEINEFELSVPIDQNILCLDIPVNNISVMKIKQSFRYDNYKLLCFFFLESMLWF